MNQHRNQQSSILNQIHGLNHLINTLFDRYTSMGRSRFEMLTIIQQAQEITQIQLQKMISIDASAVTRHLQQLEHQGLIQRKRNIQDLRIMLIRITALGKTQLKKTETERRNLIEGLFSGLDQDDVQQLEMLLIKLKQHATDTKNQLQK